MAYNSHSSLMAILLIFNILLAITCQAFAGRDIPTQAKDVDKKQPEFFFNSDGGTNFPGFGPVSGWLKGGGLGTGIFGGSGGSGGSYVPGGDDTFVPNPGAEIPNPGGYASISGTSSP